MTEQDALSPAPEVVQDLANSCVRFVAEALEAPLDFTQDTLPLLDHYLRSAADAEDEILGLVIPAAGAYFGEVVRRHLGIGHWSVKGEDYRDWRLELPPGLSTNPIGVAFECATGDAADGWGAELRMPEPHRQRIESALAAMGDVRESDYYTLGVRFEAIELVHAHLSSRGRKVD